MKLKEQTFAVIAEKQNSISYKWFNENIKKGSVEWINSGQYYMLYAGELKHSRNCPIYTESEFEELIKKEEIEQAIKEIKESDAPEWAKPKSTLRPLNELNQLTEKVLNTEQIPEPKVIIPMIIAKRIIAERFNLLPIDIRIEP